MALDKTDYVLKSLIKLVCKKWELYIVSRIIHRLDDDEIEFVTQQLVRLKDGRYALTDLYFPQFKLHLEIDEPHHEKQQDEDIKREYDIVNAIDHEIRRIRVSNNGNIRSLVSINSEIDDVVSDIRKMKADLVANGTFVPWDFDSRFSAAVSIQRGIVSISDNTVFQKQIEALKCFGFPGRDLQRGTWTIPDGSDDYVWFPRLYEYKLWRNELTADGETIYERATGVEGLESLVKQRKDWKAKPSRRAIVFAKARDPLGGNLLRYVGSFVVDWEKSSDNALAFKRIAAKENVRVRS